MKYHIVTYGCQMNVHESEKIAGFLRAAGYAEESGIEEADIVVFNTCCIRENAENHAFGNIGALKKLKRRKKGMLIAVGGCMAQEPGKAELLVKKFPFIDIIFGTHNVAELPDLIERKKREKKIVSLLEDRAETEDGAQPVRTSYPNAWVNITYAATIFARTVSCHTYGAGKRAAPPPSFWTKCARWSRRGIGRSRCSGRMSIPTGTARRIFPRCSTQWHLWKGNSACGS